MRRLVASLIVGGALIMSALPASAQTIVRDGADYNGIANPHGCIIKVHEDLPGSLHVNCSKADGPARIRYRFLRAVGGQFAPADVTVDWEKRGDGGEASVSWMVPVPRTVRIKVRGYVHIHSVTWTQPPANR